MTRTEAVKMIMNMLNCGLPAAIEKYNWLSCYGEIVVTEEMIERNCAL